MEKIDMYKRGALVGEDDVHMGTLFRDGTFSGQDSMKERIDFMLRMYEKDISDQGAWDYIKARLGNGMVTYIVEG